MLNIWSGNIEQKKYREILLFPSVFYGRGTFYKKNTGKFYYSRPSFMVGEHCTYVWSVYSRPQWTEIDNRSSLFRSGKAFRSRILAHFGP